MTVLTYEMTAYHNDKVVFRSTVLATRLYDRGTDLGNGWRLVKYRPESTQEHVHIDVERIPAR
jgi:hypothetical protein